MKLLKHIKINSQAGFVYMALPVLLIVVVVGLVAFLLISSAFPFHEKKLSGIFPKKSAFASGISYPSSLSNNFQLGVFALDDIGAGNIGLGWMQNTKIPWDYSEIYSSGGVTGQGWDTWATPPGEFARDYAIDANKGGYIPIIAYYNILQSSGSCNGCGDDKKILSNLNNPTVMAPYYANFELMMKRLGTGTYDQVPGYGGTAIVVLEPDAEGYANRAVEDPPNNCYGYCSSSSSTSDPSVLSAAVNNTSFADVDLSSLPNTYAGYNWALLKIRDTYAPNVLLAFWVSTWSSGQDIGTGPHTLTPPYNVTAQSKMAADFAAGVTNNVPSGISSFDLISNDPGDAQDAGYANYACLNNPASCPQDSDYWWDQLNLTFPNFHYWESYINTIYQETNTPFLITQVPEGNQYFDNMNNSDGHYQANKAGYFLSHIPELVNSGIIGLVFGQGADTCGRQPDGSYVYCDSTVHYDADSDGQMPDPTPMCTTDGLEGIAFASPAPSPICNNHSVISSDDDGGFIRMQGQAYYLNPYTLRTSLPLKPGLKAK